MVSPTALESATDSPHVALPIFSHSLPFKIITSFGV